MRTQSPKQVKNGGFIHYLDGNTPRPESRPDPRRPSFSRHDMELMARQFSTAVNPDRLEVLACHLGLSVGNLQRLHIGWCTASRAWSFPMTDAAGRVLGIRLRTDAGKKFSVTGGHEGCFVADDLPADGPLVICEGPTSCCALLDLGFRVIGRPSCMGGSDIVLAIAGARRQDVVVFGDHDSDKHRPDGSTFRPGQDGARALARKLVEVSRSVKVVIPPFNKDARDAVRAGATHRTIAAWIAAAPYFLENTSCTGSR